jgi:TolA-binding protein/outer membrane protein OmpA-like peptidoglycan-associated protein
MIKMAKDQQLTVTPNPLEVHGDSAAFDMSALLPVKMLKKNKIYTLETSYKYGDQKLDLQDVEFKSTDYPNAKTEQPKVQKHYSFFYKPEIGNGKVVIVGTASNMTKTKTKSTEELPIADGIITTSRLVKDIYYVAYADHGYNNKEELVPVVVNFYFEQGKSKLRNSEMKGTSGKNLDAFIASANVTRTVNIIGSHSPEGSEAANTKLADERAKVIEKYYKERMKYFNRKSAVDSIQFVTKGIVHDFEPFKKLVESTDLLNSSQKSEILAIVNGPGSFVERAKKLEKLPYYKKILLGKLYPELRKARTEILTVKKKKSNVEIGALAKAITEGTLKVDTLSTEELAYAATLTPSLQEKEAIYKALVKKADNWVSYNNLGAVYLEMAQRETDPSAKAKLVDMAKTNLDISIKKKESAEANSNLSVVYAMKNMGPEAFAAISKAQGMEANDDLKKGMNGIRGTLEIKEGKYDLAIQSLSKSHETPTIQYNLALANLLKKDFNAAKSGFASYTSNSSNDPLGHYLAAVTAARMQDEGSMTASLKKAVSLDKNLIEKAMKDLEFMNYWNSDNFKNALK